ncbi:hypothetical protein AAG570_004978 [Ranatra chinensis]|uniref:Uncharacterized protein n=1 Tax=Ranatra chinensis TaxID=642074 RepID=A0ABD0XZ48_9HEMI
MASAPSGGISGSRDPEVFRSFLRVRGFQVIHSSVWKDQNVVIVCTKMVRTGCYNADVTGKSRIGYLQGTVWVDAFKSRDDSRNEVLLLIHYMGYYSAYVTYSGVGWCMRGMRGMRGEGDGVPDLTLGHPLHRRELRLPDPSLGPLSVPRPSADLQEYVREPRSESASDPADDGLPPEAAMFSSLRLRSSKQQQNNNRRQENNNNNDQQNNKQPQAASPKKSTSKCKYEFTS